MSLKTNAIIVLITAVAVLQVSKIFEPRLPPAFGGNVEPGFEKVAEVFRQQVESGLEPGASFAAYYKGKLVVNLWGGYADEAIRLPWQNNTLNQFYSTTKAMGAIMIAMLVDRGLIDYEATVASYWPEFAQNGKENIKVKELLSHQAAVAALDVKFDISLMAEDQEKLAEILAQQKPNWELGTGFGYHAVTFGLYVDQLIRRVDPQQRSAQQFFADEVAAPFGIDFFVGKPLSEHHRAARQSEKLNSVIRTLSELPLKDAIQTLKFVFTMPELSKRAFFNPTGLETGSFPSQQNLGIVSYNGFGTAEGAAKVFNILAMGGKSIDNKVLLSKKAVERLATPLITGTDKTLLIQNFSFAPGTMVLQPLFGMTESVFGHYGYGCQSGFADLKHKLGWAYTTNYVSGIWDARQERRYANVLKEVYASVKRLEAL